MLDGTVACWGDNHYGQLGDGTNDDRKVPVEVVAPTSASKFLSGIVSVGAGDNYSCALDVAGAVYCWGAAGPYGSLGSGSTYFQTPIPTRVWIAERVREIAIGEGHACALLDTADRSIKCWGNNGYGQLGDGTLSDRPVPVDVVITEHDGTRRLLAGIRHITAGSSHSCAVLDDGSAACWGSGLNGERGDGLFGGAQKSPVSVLSGDGKSVLKDVSQISAGGDAFVGESHTCVRFSSTWLVSCWGANFHGELGNPTVLTQTALPVSVAAGVHQVSAGYFYTCAVLADGRASCWGDGRLGELGMGSTTTGSNAPLILSSATVVNISASDIQTCAVMTDSGVQCWGTGFLGNGTDGDKTSFYPVDVLAGSL